jgi:hypothetical protein
MQARLNSLPSSRTLAWAAHEATVGYSTPQATVGYSTPQADTPTGASMKRLTDGKISGRSQVGQRRAPLDLPPLVLPYGDLGDKTQ